jgi:hypothetical protein
MVEVVRIWDFSVTAQDSKSTEDDQEQYNNLEHAKDVTQPDAGSRSKSVQDDTESHTRNSNASDSPAIRSTAA